MVLLIKLELYRKERCKTSRRVRLKARSGQLVQGSGATTRFVRLVSLAASGTRGGSGSLILSVRSCPPLPLPAFIANKTTSIDAWLKGGSLLRVLLDVCLADTIQDEEAAGSDE